MTRARLFRSSAFTLVEWLVTTTILAILVTLAAQVCNTAQWIQCSGNRHLNADEEARAVFDRMAMDFAQMIKRPDVDYWLKDDWNWQAGNDTLAVFSSVPGYYPKDAWNSPISVVGYRVDSALGLQRSSSGLLWNGTKCPQPEMMFSGTSRSSLASGANTLWQNWEAVIAGGDDGNNESAGPEVFRMEYYYVIRCTGTSSAQMSPVPWDERQLGHAAVYGLRDVAALGVVMALIDSKSRAQVSESDMATLTGGMPDFSREFAAPGELEARWREAVNASALPPAVKASIRIYRRWFYLYSSPLRNP